MTLRVISFTILAYQPNRPAGAKAGERKFRMDATPKTVTLVNPWTKNPTQQAMTWAQIRAWCIGHVHQQDRAEWLAAAREAFKSDDGNALGAMIIGS